MEFQIVTVTALEPSVPKQLPPPNSDFYHFAETLSADELAILKNRRRAFMETKVAPLVNKLLGRRRFPARIASRVQGAEPRALTTVAWTTPTLVEICIGLEINGYLPAEF